MKKLLISLFFLTISSAHAVDYGQLYDSVDKGKAAESVDTNKAMEAMMK